MKKFLLVIIALAAIATLSNALFEGFSSQFGWRNEMREGIWWFGVLQMAAGFCVALVVMELMDKKSISAPETKKTIIFTE